MKPMYKFLVGSMCVLSVTTAYADVGRNQGQTASGKAAVAECQSNQFNKKTKLYRSPNSNAWGKCSNGNWHFVKCVDGYVQVLSTNERYQLGKKYTEDQLKIEYYCANTLCEGNDPYLKPVMGTKNGITGRIRFKHKHDKAFQCEEWLPLCDTEAAKTLFEGATQLNVKKEKEAELQSLVDSMSEQQKKEFFAQQRNKEEYEAYCCATKCKTPEYEEKPVGCKCVKKKVEPKTYTINYECGVDGDCNKCTPKKYTEGTDTSITCKPERTGYTFDGWKDSAGTKVTKISSTQKGDITLTAQWVENKKPEYNINYDCNGGGNACDICTPKTYTEGVSTQITCQPNRTGYTFDGWYDSANKKISSIPATQKGDIKLTAQWVENKKPEYNINYDCNGGTGCTENCTPKKYTEGTTPSINCNPTPTKSDYNFVGWQDADGNSVTTIPSGSTTDITLTAQWTQEPPKTGTITYLCGDDGTGCDSCKPTTYTAGESVTITDCNPDKADSTFTGWQDQNGDTIVDSFTGASNAPNMTLTAQWSTRDCTEAEKAQHPNATEFKFENGKCIPIKCQTGFKLQNGKCIDPGIKKAQEKYDEAKGNEQSLANRTLGSLTMAATGVGGMELAMGLSQQQADKKAEDDMTAYLSTFSCKAGDKRYTGGDKNIETPGANQLIGMYQEYVDLAASLKERKAALGLKPGIEAEVVLDKSATGMYNDVGHGIENGTYASLYRAAKGNENDIKKLQEDKDSAKKRVIAGGVIAGAGVVGGIAGNIAINGERSKADTKGLAESTTRLSKSSTELLRKGRTGTVLSTADTNELLQAIQDKFK